MSSFILKHGGKLETVDCLKEYLPSMPDDVFSHHVNEERNDFATWLADVFEHHELASELRACHSKEDMHRSITQYQEEMGVLKQIAKQLDEASRLLAEAAGMKH